MQLNIKIIILRTFRSPSLRAEYIQREHVQLGTLLFGHFQVLRKNSESASLYRNYKYAFISISVTYSDYNPFVNQHK